MIRPPGPRKAKSGLGIGVDGEYGGIAEGLKI
jgi:hypothetical protein